MVYENASFQRLIEAGQPSGEVVGVNRFLVTVKGLEGVPLGALVLFENGHQGMVREVRTDSVLILDLNGEDIVLGTLVALESNEITVGAGEGLIGRVVSALGQPLDGKGPIKVSASHPLFGRAPGVIERAVLNEALPSGVTVVDMLFPIVLGQRIAILGDAKSGKSSFATALTINQLNTGRVVIYVLIAKRKVDVDTLLGKLEASGAIKHSIVVIANIFDSLAQSFLAPYTACAIGEYLWQNGRDVILIYDDLSSHAKVHREISLLARVNPGRDSYPGDTFYIHSSLLERAGKLAKNGKTLSALPVVVTPNDDITGYLPTSIMSITDGQIIFDLKSFREGVRPAVNTGLSVSRVGGRAQSAMVKKIAQDIFKRLTDYRQAAEFSHFGSELAIKSQADLELGKRIYDAFRQGADDTFSLKEQQVIMDAVLRTEGRIRISVESLKKQAKQMAASLGTDQDLEAATQKLLADNTIQAAPAPALAPTKPATPAGPPDPKSKGEK